MEEKIFKEVYASYLEGKTEREQELKDMLHEEEEIIEKNRDKYRYIIEHMQYAGKKSFSILGQLAKREPIRLKSKNLKILLGLKPKEEKKTYEPLIYFDSEGHPYIIPCITDKFNIYFYAGKPMVKRKNDSKMRTFNYYNKKNTELGYICDFYYPRNIIPRYYLTKTQRLKDMEEENRLLMDDVGTRTANTHLMDMDEGQNSLMRTAILFSFLGGVGVAVLLMNFM